MKEKFRIRTGTMTENTMDKYTAMINQGFLENKIKMIPTSVKETYSDLVSQNPVLISRELIADNKVVLGVEYSPDGDPVCAYTADNKGNRVNIEKMDNQVKSYEDYALKDLISERLQVIANIQENKAAAKTQTTAPKAKAPRVQNTGGVTRRIQKTIDK